MYRRMVILGALALVVPAGLAGPASAAPVTCHGVRATIVGAASGQTITGTAGADVIVGLGGADVIHGRGGDDRICGGSGNDSIYGGRGDDRLYGGLDRVHLTDEGTTERIGDGVRGGSGNDHLFGGADTRPADDISRDAIYWDTASGRMHIDLAAGVATGQGQDTFLSRGTWVVGSSHGDVIEGGSRRDLVNGGPGPDQVRSHGGNDRIVADRSLGQVEGGADLVYGGTGDDQISAGAGRDEIHGGSGADAIDDLAPTVDRMYGGRGPDMLFAQLADVPGVPEVTDGGPGVHDYVDIFTNVLNPTASPATGSWNMATGALVFHLDHPVSANVAGFERGNLMSFGASWVIQGTSGADEVSGASTAGTSFTARAGDDVFLGSASDDTFNGGPGTDHSLGMGVGDDTCVSVEVIDGGDCEHVDP